MNKKNKILVGCLALLLVLSVGYALFSETITINGTATAKGDFDITVSEADMTNEGVLWMYGSGEHSRGIVENPIININGNAVTTSVTLGSPGSYYGFGIRLENTGSIPAKLKSIKDLTRNVVILDKDTQNIDYTVYEIGTEQNGLRVTLFNEDGYVDDYQYGVDDYVRSTDSFGDPDAMLSAVLEPGEYLYFFFDYAWLTSSTIQEEDLTLSWNVQFNFEQVTAN